MSFMFFADVMHFLRVLFSVMLLVGFFLLVRTDKIYTYCGVQGYMPVLWLFVLAGVVWLFGMSHTGQVHLYGLQATVVAILVLVGILLYHKKYSPQNVTRGYYVVR